MPDVYWLIAAQRRFQEALSATRLTGKAASEFSKLCAQLAATFPNAATVIVRDRFRGYRDHVGRHILLVEVIHGTKQLEGHRIAWPEFCEPQQGQETHTSAHVVKFADNAEILRAELNCWEKCRPVGMTHDSVLMHLRPGARGDNNQLLSIIYEDANHVIGAGSAMALEEAVIGCCLWNTPTASSIELVIRVLFERFGADFYPRSRVVETPEENFALLLQWKKFDKWLAQWQDQLAVGSEPQLDRLRIRREVLAMLAQDRNFFIDPVDYLRGLGEDPRFCPLLLWGCSDGDLHGRNVLVNVLEDAATLPAVFDYGEMGLENLIGWDFVKLETELKVRVLPRLVGGSEAKYLFSVLEFERYLADCTHALHDQREAPRAEFDTDGLNRLAAIVLTIRRQAQRHLGIQRYRDRQWLEEYYFLLACYGMRAALFEAYQCNRRQIAAAFVSAGVAARLLSRPTQQLDATMREASEEAARRIKQPNFDPCNFEPVPDEKSYSARIPGEMSYHARLAFANKWVGSKNAAFVDGAIKLLEKLQREYPHVLEIEDGLALAYLERHREADFEDLVGEAKKRYRQMSEEFLCRIGRFWKEKGDEALAKNSRDLARQHFEEALKWYGEAFAIRDHYYPGINVAGLQLVLSMLLAAQQTAAKLLQALAGRSRSQELNWILATKADAYVILGQSDKAEALYREAAAKSDPRGRSSIRKQLERLVGYAPKDLPLGEYWTSARITEVFGGDNGAS